MLKWFEKTHPIFKAAAMLAGVLLLKYSDRLPGWLQDSAAWAGVLLAGFAAFGLILYFLKRGKRMTASDIVMFGLIGAVAFSLLALGAFGWQYLWPPSQSNSDASAGPSTDTEASAAIPNQRYLSPADKDRIAEALYKLSELNNKQVHQLCEDAGKIVPAWSNMSIAQRTTELPKIIAQLDDAHSRAISLLSTIYVAWLREYQDYSQELIDVLEYPEKENVRIPLNKFIKAAGELRSTLGDYEVVASEQMSEEAQNAARRLVVQSMENYRWAVGDLVGGWAKLNTLIERRRNALK